METVSVKLPKADLKLFETISERFGWVASLGNKKRHKSLVEEALDDVDKGDVVSFDSVDEMMSYLNS